MSMNECVARPFTAHSDPLLKDQLRAQQSQNLSGSRCNLLPDCFQSGCYSGLSKAELPGLPITHTEGK